MCFGFTVSEDKALYVTDLLTWGVVHLLCQFWDSWDQLNINSGGSLVCKKESCQQHSLSEGPLSLWCDSSHSLVQNSVYLLAMKTIYLCNNEGHLGQCISAGKVLGGCEFQGLKIIISSNDFHWWNVTSLLIFVLVYVLDYMPVVLKSWDLGVHIFYTEFKT